MMLTYPVGHYPHLVAASLDGSDVCVGGRVVNGTSRNFTMLTLKNLLRYYAKQAFKHG